MIWLTWRQFRAQALATLVVLLVATIYLLITGFHMRDSYHADLATCAAQNDCGSLLNTLQGRYNAAFQLCELLLVAVPALIGIFWGAPLIARELETGTYQLAWNQSVMRTRWLAVKLGGVALVALVTAGALSLLLTWWAGPLDRIQGDRFGAMTFATRDIAPLGYALFAFALGTTAGLLLRRTIPAMAVTLAVFIAVQILVPTAVRPNLMPSTTVTVKLDQATMAQANGIQGVGGNRNTFNIIGLDVPAGAWVLSDSSVQNASGQDVSMQSVNQCLPQPGTVLSTPNIDPFSQFGACVASDDLHETVTYQPASHYWPLQWFETGLFLVLAGLLSGFCFWSIRRRQN
jgi:ABC-type transport system involved in multi-copper enzyme maturation permease subunit